MTYGWEADEVWDEHDEPRCEECGVATFTDSPFCAECDAAEDCGMVIDDGVYRCLDDGSEECCFVCPNYKMLGTRAEVLA